MALTQNSPRAPWALLGPAYAVALLLVFLGEHVVVEGAAHYLLSGLGVAAVIAVTALRFALAMRTSGERRLAERTLGILSALGLIALGLYFTTTEAVRARVGFAKLSPDSRARVDGASLVAWIALLVIALLPLLFGELALAPMRRAAHIEARRVRSAIAAGFSVAFALIYCTLFTYVAGELDLKADYSFFRTSKPSESTRKIAAGATEPIKVQAFFPQLNEVGTEVESYLHEASAGAQNLKIETYDRLLVPAIAKDAKVTQDGTLVLTRGNARETLSIGADMKTAAAKLKTLDADFQKSLLKVMREAHIAYLTVGHGELNETGNNVAEGRTGKVFRRLLESQNYTVKDLGLTQGLGTEIPEDATVVVALGPAQPFLPEEIGALRRYAERGGHLFLALDPDAKVDLSALAGVVGLTWKPTLLANDKVYLRHRYNNSDRTLLVTNRFSSHASVSTLSRNSSRAQVIFLGASSLDKRDGGDEKVDFAVKTLADTFEDLNGNFEFDAATEKRNTYNLAAAVSRAVPPPPGYKGKDPPEMRAFVVTDADALSDAAFGNEPNAFFAVDVVRWLGGEESFSGSITTTDDVHLEHTKQKDSIWFYATIFGLPALLLGVGLAVTRRRPSALKEKQA